MKPAIESAARMTIYHAKPKAEVQNLWTQAVSESEDRNYLEPFITITKALLDSDRAAFTIDDATRLAKVYEIPNPSLRRMFLVFTNTLVKHNRLRKVEGCYNVPVFYV